MVSYRPESDCSLICESSPFKKPSVALGDKHLISSRTASATASKMATSINDHHQLDDHLFEKGENPTNGRLFRPWDCAMNETAKATIKAHLKENNIDLNGLSDSLKELKELSCLKELAGLKELDALKDLNDLNRLKDLGSLGDLNNKLTMENSKSSLLPKLPNDYLTEMFSTNCTMNQSSLTAMETLYGHFYRDYLASSSKSLAMKMKNGNSLTSNDLSLLNTFSSKMNLSKIVNDANGLSGNGLASSSLLANGLITDNLIANRLTPLSSASSLRMASSSKLASSSFVEQRSAAAKLSSTSANEPITSLSSSNPLPVNSATKTADAASRFLTPLQIDKNQSKKPRPKRFRCPHCDIAFSNNGQLKGHIRTHTGERPFVCDNPTCGKTFTRNEELTRHKRIHTGLRPYDCHICSKKFGRKDHLKKHQRTHDKRKLALAKSSAGLQSLGNPLCCLPSSFGASSFSNKNKLSINRSGSVVGRSEKQSLGKASLDVGIKQPKKPETTSPSKLNAATKTIGSLSAIDPITGLTKGGSNGFVYDAKFSSNHNFAGLTGSAISSALSSTLNSLNTISLANSKSIENQLISSNSNAASHLPLSSASPSMSSLSSISNSFLGSNHSLPALSSLSMNGRTTGNLNGLSTVSSLIGGAAAANPSFSNQFNQITSNHRPTTTISSPTSSECSFNSTLSTSINSPSLSLNALPFSNPLYFNPLMLTFIQ